METLVEKPNFKYDFKDAAPLLQTGDVAMFRGKTWVSWLIKHFGGGPYSHVAMVSKIGSNGKAYTELVEFREFIGSRAVSLRSQLDNQDIDIFRPIKEIKTSKYAYTFNGVTAVDYIRAMTGTSYSYWKILVFVMQRVPFVRWFVSSYFEEDSNDTLQVCSTAVAEALCRGYEGVHLSEDDGGVVPPFDIMPFKPNGYMEPNDVARTAALEYLFTIRAN